MMKKQRINRGLVEDMRKHLRVQHDIVLNGDNSLLYAASRLVDHTINEPVWEELYSLTVVIETEGLV